MLALSAVLKADAKSEAKVALCFHYFVFYGCSLDFIYIHIPTYMHGVGV